MAKRKKSTLKRLQSSTPNRQQRKKLQRQVAADSAEVIVVHPNAAGIDGGNPSHFGSGAPERYKHQRLRLGSWTRAVQHIQKALTTMNVQLANAISDVSGVTGMAIVRAIVQGQRDPHELAKLRDPHIRASEEEIAHSLEGNWQRDVLFELQQVVDAYDFHRQQLAIIDTELQKYMTALPTREPVGEVSADISKLSAKLRKKLKANRKSKDNRPAFDLGAELARLMGVDLRLIDGIDVMTIQTINSEGGAGLSDGPTEGSFASWLELAPRNNITGGKVIKKEKRP